MPHRLRILHVSDLHLRGDREREPWRRRRVLGDSWERNLEDLLEDGPVDLVAFTGDLAFSGRPDEYEGVTGFIQAMLDRVKLGADRLFVVPGNHDIDRSISAPAWSTLRRELRPSDALELSRWMASKDEWAPRGFQASQRDEVLARQEAWRHWLRHTLQRPELLPSPSLHPRLGYRATLRLPGLPFAIHVIGLDSAWLAGDDHDQGKLWLTDDQVMRLSTDERGGKLPGFRLALLHHPLDNLVDGAEARRLLAQHTDLLLRGHLHEAEAVLAEEPSLSLRTLAAGCLYEHDRFPNSCQLLQVTLDAEGRPLGHDLRFRTWSSRGFWHDDDSLYPGTRGGRLRWKAAPALEDLGGASFHPGVGSLFVGREEQLRQLAEALLPAAGGPRPVSLQGMPGVGKSYLVDRFALLHAERFPGGYVRLALEADEHRDANTLLQTLAARLGLQPGQGSLTDALRGRLRSPPTLLSIDNVDGPAVAAAVAEAVRRLAGCTVLVSGRFQNLGSSAGWAQVKLGPLDETLALEQLTREYRQPRGPEERTEFQRLVRELGHLPLAIHLAAGYLRKGRSVDGFLTHLRRRKLELGPGDPADPLHAEGTSRAILRRSFDLSLGLLRELADAEWGPEAGPLLAGLSALGFSPASGVGRSLGAAIAGLPEDGFESLVTLATELSVMDRVPETERPGRDAWRIHPLLAELLQEGAAQSESLDRMTRWFTQRLVWPGPGREEECTPRWAELREEETALVAWLPQVPPEHLAEVVLASVDYSQLRGPYPAWTAFYERAQARIEEPKARSKTLQALCALALRADLWDRVWEVALELQHLARAQGDELEHALASGFLAQALKWRGQQDEALRILYEEVLPVLERQGQTHYLAVHLFHAAELHMDRGELDEALRILRDEQRPLLEAMGDAREYALSLNQEAEILSRRGMQREELRIRREEVLPIFERLGDVHARAFTLHQIAKIHHTGGELDEALRTLREEVIPVFERIGDMSAHAMALDEVGFILRDKRKWDEALHVLREELPPLLERLGDERRYALNLIRIGNIYALRGKPDEARRLWREKVLPLCERLGDRTGRALVFFHEAHILQGQGELDEALRLLHEEVLPGLEQQGNPALLTATHQMLAYLLALRRDSPADRFFPRPLFSTRGKR